MPPTVSYQIMAVPERAEWANALAKKLRCGVTWDETRNVWDTGRRALLSHGDTDWHVVVQDDVLLSEHFTKTTIRQALAHVPEHTPVAFYTGAAARSRHPQIVVAHKVAAETGAGWVTYRGPVWGPAVAVPTADVEQIVNHGDRDISKGYDTKIMNAYRGIWRADCWYTSPSLVDHRPVSENPSAISASGRTADRRVLALGEPRDWTVAQSADRAVLYPWVWMTDGRRTMHVRQGTHKHGRLVQKGWEQKEPAP